MTWKIEDDTGTIYHGDREFVTDLFANMVLGKGEQPPTTGEIRLIKEIKLNHTHVYAVIKNRPVHG